MQLNCTEGTCVELCYLNDMFEAHVGLSGITGRRCRIKQAVRNEWLNNS